ncbi:Serine/threonine-protein kinase atr [Bienertia sinuspersici]
MYAIERYLREMKSDVRNKDRLEGSMAEGFSAKECSRFCARHVMRSHITPIMLLILTLLNRFFLRLAILLRVRERLGKSIMGLSLMNLHGPKHINMSYSIAIVTKLRDI